MTVAEAAGLVVVAAGLAEVVLVVVQAEVVAGLVAAAEAVGEAEADLAVVAVGLTRRQPVEEPQLPLVWGSRSRSHT
jgi:hypothetical protein